MSIYARPTISPNVDLSGELRQKTGDVHVVNASLSHYDASKVDPARITSPAAGSAPRPFSEYLAWVRTQLGYSSEQHRLKVPPLIPFERKRASVIYTDEATEYHSAQTTAVRQINDARRGIPAPITKTGAPPKHRLAEPSGHRDYAIPIGLVSAQNKTSYIGYDRRPVTTDTIQKARENAGPGLMSRLFNYY